MFEILTNERRLDLAIDALCWDFAICEPRQWSRQDAIDIATEYGLSDDDVRKLRIAVYRRAVAFSQSLSDKAAVNDAISLLETALEVDESVLTRSASKPVSSERASPQNVA